MPISATASSAAWTKILDRVQQALTQALAELAERQRGLNLATSPPPPGTAPWQQQLAQCDARLEQLRTWEQQADGKAAAASGALEASEMAFRDWLAEAAVLLQGQTLPADPVSRPQLADAATPEV